MTNSTNTILALKASMNRSLQTADNNSELNEEKDEICKIEYDDKIYNIKFDMIELNFSSFKKSIKRILALHDDILVYYQIDEDVIANRLMKVCEDQFHDLLEWNASKEDEDLDFNIIKFIVKIDEKSGLYINLLESVESVLKSVDKAAVKAEHAAAELTKRIEELEPATGMTLSEEVAAKAAQNNEGISYSEKYGITSYCKKYGIEQEILETYGNIMRNIKPGNGISYSDKYGIVSYSTKYGIELDILSEKADNKEEIIKAANELIRPAPGILLSEESGIKAALKRPANVVIL
eukprot:24843_1